MERWSNSKRMDGGRSTAGAIALVSLAVALLGAYASGDGAEPGTNLSDNRPPAANSPRVHVWQGDTTVVIASSPVNPRMGRLVEELSIGALDGTELYTFGSVSGLVVGAEDMMYVADEKGVVIRQYDRDGKHVRSFGRDGEGPGEFGSLPRGLPAAFSVTPGPDGITMMSDGRVVVRSIGGRRIIFYDGRGRTIETRSDRSLSLRYGFEPPLLKAVRGDIIYVRYDVRPFPADYVGTALRRSPPRLYARWNAEGTPLDTIVEPHWPLDPPIVHIGNQDRPRRFRQVPFTPDYAWTLSPRGYFVTGFPVDRGKDSYSLELRLPVPRESDKPGALTRWEPGDPVISIRVPYKPVALGREERRDWISAYSAWMRELDSSWRWNAPEIPAYKPPYKALWIDDEGRIWVSLHSAGSLQRSITAQSTRGRSGRPNPGWAKYRWPEPHVFDIIEASGRYLGQVTSVDKIIPQVARGDRLWAVVETDEAHLTVKRYRIVWE